MNFREEEIVNGGSLDGYIFLLVEPAPVTGGCCHGGLLICQSNYRCKLIVYTELNL